MGAGPVAALRCAARAPLFVNIVIYAELLLPRPDVRAMDALLAVYDAQRGKLPWDCAALATRPGRGPFTARPVPA